MRIVAITHGLEWVGARIIGLTRTMRRSARRLERAWAAGYHSLISTSRGNGLPGLLLFLARSWLQSVRQNERGVSATPSAGLAVQIKYLELGCLRSSSPGVRLVRQVSFFTPSRPALATARTPCTPCSQGFRQPALAGAGS